MPQAFFSKKKSTQKITSFQEIEHLEQYCLWLITKKVFLPLFFAIRARSHYFPPPYRPSFLLKSATCSATIIICPLKAHQQPATTLACRSVVNKKRLCWCLVAAILMIEKRQFGESRISIFFMQWFLWGRKKYCWIHHLWTTQGRKKMPISRAWVPGLRLAESYIRDTVSRLSNKPPATLLPETFFLRKNPDKFITWFLSSSLFFFIRAKGWRLGPRSHSVVSRLLRKHRLWRTLPGTRRSSAPPKLHYWLASTRHTLDLLNVFS